MEITLFTKCLFEFIGTLVLVLLGDGVVASTVLKQSKGFNGGWAVITIAWGLAVMCGVLIAGPYSGAHLNPAVSVGLAVAGSFPWAFVPGYIAAQLLGGFCGAVLVYVYYKDHFDATDDPATKLGVFCTMPAIMDKPRNLFCEFLGTFLLVFVILAIGNEQNTPEIGMGSLGSLPAFTVRSVTDVASGFQIHTRTIHVPLLRTVIITGIIAGVIIVVAHALAA